MHTLLQQVDSARYWQERYRQPLPFWQAALDRIMAEHRLVSSPWTRAALGRNIVFAAKHWRHWSSAWRRPCLVAIRREDCKTSTCHKPAAKTCELSLARWLCRLRNDALHPPDCVCYNDRVTLRPRSEPSCRIASRFQKKSTGAWIDRGVGSGAAPDNPVRRCSASPISNRRSLTR